MGDKNIIISHISCEEDTDNNNNIDFCYYYIGVYCKSDCQYSLFVHEDNSNTEYIIQDSIPIKRTIESNNFIFFKYNLIDSKNIQNLLISLTPFSGNPVCYISSIH